MDDAGRIELPADAIAERLAAHGLCPDVATAAALRALAPGAGQPFDADVLAELDRRRQAIERGEVEFIPLEDFRKEMAELIRRLES